MNPDRIKDLLADYLGGELEPPDKLRFEQYLETDPDFAAEVASLRKTLSAMRSLELPAQPPARGSGPSGWAAVWRYAAVILLAFTGGFVVRDLSGHGTAPPPVVAREEQDRPRDWETLFASAYAANADKSGLARSLLALAQATR